MCCIVDQPTACLSMQDPIQKRSATIAERPHVPAPVCPLYTTFFAHRGTVVTVKKRPGIRGAQDSPCGTDVLRSLQRLAPQRGTHLRTDARCSFLFSIVYFGQFIGCFYIFGKADMRRDYPSLAPT